MESGTKLGHYTILSALGKGGMGEVWRARDTKLRREVLIKPLTHNGKPPPLAVRLEEVRPSRRAVLVDGLHQRTTTCELKETVIGEWQCQSHDGLYRIGRVTRRPRHRAKATGGL